MQELLHQLKYVPYED